MGKHLSKEKQTNVATENQKKDNTENTIPVRKIMLIGGSSWGRSTMIHRYIKGVRPDTLCPTIGINRYNKVVDV